MFKKRLISLFFVFVLATGNLKLAAVENYAYTIANIYPHNHHYFTQGLIFHGNDLFESSGLYGVSKLIKYQLQGDTLKFIKQRDLPKRYFAEGITLVNGELWLLTWRAGDLFIFDRESLALTGRKKYKGEGWGVAMVKDDLVRSDGSHYLWQHLWQNRQVELAVKRKIVVSYKGARLNQLNELEWLAHKNILAANRFNDHRIYFIQWPEGLVVAQLDLAALVQPQADKNAVLNGIAWHSERQTLWVTGKLWNAIYELKVDGLQSP